MIEADVIERMLGLTTEYWSQQLVAPEFLSLAGGKEIGHRIANYVDEPTTTLIAEAFPTRRERRADGSLMLRSMGDIWVLSNGIYNPVNIKAGEADRNGQPNIVSLKKLLRALLRRQIDAYYVLIVKVRLAEPVRLHTHLVDILECLDFVAFDSGPGQLMLRERRFYAARSSSEPAGPTSLEEKIHRLFGLLEDADRRLRANRERVQATIQDLRHEYDQNRHRPLDQSGLHLQ